MRILWCSNNPAIGSGYGQQTGLFLPRIRQAGHEVFLFAFAGCEGTPGRMADGTLMLPRIAEPFGNDVVQAHANFVQADLVVTLGDPHIFDPDVYRNLPWCAWAPIDGRPASPKTVRALRAARWIWAVSGFVKETLEGQGFQNVVLVPHGVSPEVFRPGDRAAARAMVSRAAGADLTGRFLVSMCAANASAPSRKGFFEAFSAFKLFAEGYERATPALYVHAEASGARGGEDLHQVAALAGLKPDQIYFAPQYPLACGMLGSDYLRDVYDASDVFLSAAHGEAFCIPLVEAQLCGCPVVAPKNTGQTENVFAGELAKVTIPYMPSEGMLWARPDILDLAWALCRVLEIGEAGTDLRALARQGALSRSADVVFDQFMWPALDRIGRELFPTYAASRCPTGYPLRKQSESET